MIVWIIIGIILASVWVVSKLGWLPAITWVYGILHTGLEFCRGWLLKLGTVPYMGFFTFMDVFFIVIALFLAYKIIKAYYAKLEGRNLRWLLTALIIFLFLKFF